ncbi:MAG TPA: S49 family peptidase [Pirellulales bacterium]|nr:S49 family peptidase [Pirellulales bacterium]
MPLRSIALIAVATTLAGCLHQPLSIWTDSRVQGELVGDVTADVTGDVTARLPPTDTDLPVEPMDLPGQSGQPAAPRVAIVDVDGLLLNTDMTGPGAMGDNPVSLFRERLDRVACDRRVVAVVVRINSPGGGVTASDMMWHDLMAFKAQTHLPVVASVLDLGAGGAYYLATAADEIVAHPTSVIGGIGVILNLYNLRDTMAQFNVIGVPVKAGKKIDLGSPIDAIDEEGRKILQDMADQFHDRFRDIVLQNRKRVAADDPTNFDGRVFTASQAVDRGLADSIGYLNNAIDAAAHLAGCQHVTATFYHRGNDPAGSVYSVTPNVPWQNGLLPLSLPGLDRSRLPTFLYLWQVDPTMEKLGGK